MTEKMTAWFQSDDSRFWVVGMCDECHERVMMRASPYWKGCTAALDVTRTARHVICVRCGAYEVKR